METELSAAGLVCDNERRTATFLLSQEGDGGWVKNKDNSNLFRKVEKTMRGKVAEVRRGLARQLHTVQSCHDIAPAGTQCCATLCLLAKWGSKGALPLGPPAASCESPLNTHVAP